MRIVVHAKPNSKQEKIEKIDDENYKVFVKEPPVQGRANRAIVRILAQYFGKNVRIVIGQASREKIVDVG